MSTPEGAGTQFPPHLLSHGRLSAMAAHKTYPHHLERTLRTTTVYTKPSCVQCDQTKTWLDKNQIAYSTVDLSEDPQALDAVKALGYMGAPVVIVSWGDARDESHWYGFRPDLLAEFCKPKDVAA